MTTIEWGPERLGAQLGIAATQSVFAPGQAMAVQIFLRNNDAARSFRLPGGPPGRAWDVDVRDEQGRKVARTRLGKELDDSRRAGGPSPLLEPGALHVTTVLLGRLFDLGAPGVYVIEASGRLAAVGRKRPTRLVSGLADFRVRTLPGGEELFQERLL